MDDARFDALTRRTAAASRRGLMQAAAGWLALATGNEAAATRCRGGRIRCGRHCVDPQSSRTHCGGCKTACGDGETCATGICCPDGQRNCAGVCRADCDGAKAKRPFPQHVAYPGAAIFPNHRSRAELDADVALAYDRWKARYVVAAGNDDGQPLYRIAFAKPGKSDHAVTVSEGQGYGMVVLAHMAGHDPEARTIFDGLWRFARAHPSCVDDRLMNWRIPQTGGSGCDSAFDGDNDMAYALLLASAQWGDDGAIDYRQAFATLAGGVFASTIGPDSRLPLLGDWVEADGRKYNQWSTRTSDYMTGHFRAFARADGKNAWRDVVAACQQTIHALQAQFAPETGLLPDFVQPKSATDHAPRPADPRFLEGPNDGAYDYNAGRDPWRIGTDALVNGDATATAQALQMSRWIAGAAHGDPRAIRSGYQLDGTPSPNSNYFSTFFVAPFGVAAMLDERAQAWLNAIYDAVRDVQQDYYEDSVTLQCLLAMTGNWWDPTV
ncbi:MAG TPA: glycosyl hydrolase family 8 [Thermomicrobiales bacterium]|nr:glycosyl hydrolase family 8 [Thermomicrobiales bacterium]